MNRSGLINCLAVPHLQYPAKDIVMAVTLILDAMPATLSQGLRMTTRGFCGFVLNRRSPRIGCNSRTGIRIEVAARYIAHFKVGRGLQVREAMLKTILIMLLAIMSSNATAEWLKVHDDETTTTHANLDAIRNNSDRVEMWSISDLKMAQKSGEGKTYKSTKTRYEYDCKEKLSRKLVISLYSGEMCSGELISTNSDPDKWELAQDGTRAEKLFELACWDPSGQYKYGMASTNVSADAEARAAAQAKKKTEGKAVVPVAAIVTPVEADPLNDPNSILAKRSVYYRFNVSVVQDADKSIVKAHAKYLKEHANRKVRLEGNCDSRGSDKYNLTLGQRRADRVKKMLLQGGAKDSQIETVSNGFKKPKATGHNKASFAQNRRTDLNYDTLQK